MEEKEKKILLVEDNPRFLKITVSLLRATGFSVITATDGETAIEIVREEQPALLILDLALPKVDGFEVCRMVKSDPKTRRIPIIISSAKSGDIDKTRCGELGAEAYLVKPYDARELLDEVRKFLGE